jgi:hypothetical protein
MCHLEIHIGFLLCSDRTLHQGVIVVSDWHDVSYRDCFIKFVCLLRVVCDEEIFFLLFYFWLHLVKMANVSSLNETFYQVQQNKMTCMMVKMTNGF